jgi:hypothetical protein
MRKEEKKAILGIMLILFFSTHFVHGNQCEIGGSGFSSMQTA